MVTRKKRPYIKGTQISKPGTGKGDRGVGVGEAAHSTPPTDNKINGLRWCGSAPAPTRSLRGLERPLRWQADYDYLDKLSPKEYEWLRKFNSGHYQKRPYNQRVDAMNRLSDPTFAAALQNGASQHIYTRFHDKFTEISDATEAEKTADRASPLRPQGASGKIKPRRS